MGALTLGPVVLSLDRATAGLGFLVLLLAAEVWSRRGRPQLSTWAWRTALVTFVGARLAFVVMNLDLFAREPWTVVAIWQGGFAPLWGVAAGAASTAVALFRDPNLRATVPAIGLTALLAWWLPAGLLAEAPLSSGVTLPALELPALGGAPVALAGSGTPTIVNVWATWCPPCRRELPLLTSAAATADVRVLLVNQRESEAVVRAYLAEQGLPEAGTLLDRHGAVGAALDVAGLPTTFAFAADGSLAAVHVGELSAAGLRAMIDGLR